MQTLRVQKGRYFKTHFASMLVLMDINWNQNEKKRISMFNNRSDKIDFPHPFRETLVCKSNIITTQTISKVNRMVALFTLLITKYLGNK